MIDVMNYEDFQSLLDGPNSHYYIGRWSYFKEVIEIIKTLNIEKIIEVGPGFIPIVKNADIMLNPLEDQFGRPKTNNIIFHDATRAPWPIEDKEYDLFIALQVWEHLDGKQTRAFKEVIRTSKRAILSFPYLWEGGVEEKPSHRAHRNIDKELIADWTLHVKPEKVIEIERTGDEFSKGKRLIYYWIF